MNDDRKFGEMLALTPKSSLICGYRQQQQPGWTSHTKWVGNECECCELNERHSLYAAATGIASGTTADHCQSQQQSIEWIYQLPTLLGETKRRNWEKERRALRDCFWCGLLFTVLNSPFSPHFSSPPPIFMCDFCSVLVDLQEQWKSGKIDCEVEPTQCMFQWSHFRSKSSPKVTECCVPRIIR
jgi:hypothetical protein